MTMTRALRRRLHAVRGPLPDSGFTLSEMVVVIFILGLILTMAQGALIGTNKIVGGNVARNDQTQQARVAIESMSRSLRTAILPTQLNSSCTTCSSTAFIQGDSTYVTFYANLNNDYTVAPPPGLSDDGPSKVSYQVVSGTLTESIRRPDPHNANPSSYSYTCAAGSVGCTVRSRVLATKVVMNQPLFTYFAKDGITSIATPLEASTTRLSAVDSVDIFLTVRSAANTKGSSFTIRVQLPNVDSLSVSTTSPTP